MGDGERQPLLQSDAATIGSTVYSNNTSDIVSAITTVSPIGPDELPPPYLAATQGGIPMVTCRVCQGMIDISNKRDQHVVKCTQCNEATPIRNAPPGKKYVSPVTPPVPTLPGMCRVACAHCHDTFLFNTLNNALARCPHCRKVSSVGPDFARGRGIMFIIIGILFLAVGIGVTVSLYFVKFFTQNLTIIPEVVRKAVFNLKKEIYNLFASKIAL
ncbi:hypothetical protein L9F63_005259 [Diploptera punctata]|uniref:Phosphatidylinositol-4,5-bisphosphate 4-phosphatase n=1 Tax=Diploptera punctata TaxID=6984 RepID=A0AAD8E5Z6_DIPPU|nr:hypothetical protein L9F63_005259 [Diploptera punctata]